MLAEFRSQFVKTGEIEVEFSRFYGDTFEARQTGDYEFEMDMESGRAEIVLEEAEQLVSRVHQYLAQKR